MARPRKKGRFHRGSKVLCDFDPAIGEIVQWFRNSSSVRIFLYDNKVAVTRNKACIFFREHDGKKVHEFTRSNLLCKVREYTFKGHSDNPRNGSLIIAAWHRIYATGYQERHTGGEANIELYAIVVDGQLVHKPTEYAEISAKLPHTVGVAVAGLCII